MIKLQKSKKLQKLKPMNTKVLVLAVFSCFSGSLAWAASEVSLNGGEFQPMTSPITIIQENSNNAVGVIENTARSDSAILQKGNYNRVAIIQMGNDKAILLRQPGLLNRAMVVQVASTAQDHQTIDARQGDSADAVNYIYSLQTSADTVNSSNPLEAEFNRLTVDQAKMVAKNFILAPELSLVNVGMVEDISLHFSAALQNDIDQNRFKLCNNQEEGCENSNKPFFATLGYGKTDKNGTTGFAGYHHQIRSATLGTHFLNTSYSQLGVAFQYTESNSTIKEGLGTVDAKGYQVGIWGSFSKPDSGYYLDLIGNAGKVDFSSYRFGDFSSVGKVNSESQGVYYRGRAQAGHFSENGSWRFGPFISASYSHATADAYQENGSILLTQAIEKQTLKKISASLGGAFYFKDSLAGYPVSSYVKAEVVRDVGRSNHDIVQSQFSFSPQIVITPLNPNHTDTYGKISAGMDIALRQDVKLVLSGTALIHADGIKRRNTYLGLLVKF